MKTLRVVTVKGNFDFDPASNVSAFEGILYVSLPRATPTSPLEQHSFSLVNVVCWGVLEVTTAPEIPTRKA